MNNATPKRRKLTVREQAIETQIRAYLGWKGIFHWKAKTVGTFDSKRGRFRKSAGYMKGVADIIGIINGKLLAIEVKSETGKLSPEQKLFLVKVRENGGIAMVARSVEDVQERLKEFL